MSCERCRKAHLEFVAQFPNAVRPHIVKVRDGNEVRDVVIWSDAWHVSCKDDVIEAARADGAIEHPFFERLKT